MLNNFTDFYNNNYKVLYNDDKINGSYLSQILNSMATDMITNIENNIKLHFFKYVKKFVNSSFRNINNTILENTEKGNKIEIRKKLNKELYEIKG
jgi:hypothetical protein